MNQRLRSIDTQYLERKKDSDNNNTRNIDEGRSARNGSTRKCREESRWDNEKKEGEGETANSFKRGAMLTLLFLSFFLGLFILF